jgi:phosphatidylglycerophosphatase A
MASPTKATSASGGGFLSSCAVALATGFGAGYSPVAPGTAGSLVGLASFVALHRLPVSYQLGATALLFVVGVAAAGHTAKRVGQKDPGLVVVDEIIGQWTTLLFLPFTPVIAIAGFVLFRVMDVLKPYPARDFERLPGGLGIVADDVMAGVYANLLLRVGLLVVPVR